MTAMTTLTGAPDTCLPDWNDIQWRKVGQQVHRLQMRIAKAFREGSGKLQSKRYEQHFLSGDGNIRRYH